MISAELISSKTGDAAQVVKSKRHPPGLFVYTHPYEVAEYSSLSFTNDTFGSSMVIDASAGGTPDNVHNGIDNVYWTASAISGTWTFNSTDQAASGTNSIDATATAGGDTALFTRASALTYTNYVSISGAIYIDDWSVTGSKDVSLQFRLAGNLLGISVNLSGFIDTTLLDTWQNFNIPLIDFNLTGTTIDELIITTLNSGGPSPNYYLDDLKIEESGGGVIFQAAPKVEEIYAVKSVEITMVDALALTVTNGTAIGLSYNNLMGVSSLPTPILLRWFRNNELEKVYNYKNIFDLISIPGSTIKTAISDGTNSMIKIEILFPDLIELKGISDDKFQMVIQDNLTGLLEMNASLLATKLIYSTFKSNNGK